MHVDAKIIIIGAGAAGFAAACRLLKSGLANVKILEAENRIGGRVYTTEFADNVVELGAQWVHGEKGNVAYNLAAPDNLLASSTFINDVTKWTFVDCHGIIVPKEQSVEVLNLYHRIYDKSAKDLKTFGGSLGEYFTKEYYNALKENPFVEGPRAAEFLEWIHKFENSIECSDSWFQTSGHGQTEYWSCDGDSVLNWKDHGYKTIFDLLMKKDDKFDQISIKDIIHYEKVVSSIDYRKVDGEIVIETEDGSRYLADHVIFTPSLGVLKEQHDTLFIPTLNETKQLTIQGLEIGTANKIFLEFPHKWWPEDSAGFSLIWSEIEKKDFLQSVGKESEWLCDVFQFFTVDYQPRVLSAWIVGPLARHVETLPDNIVFDGLYQLLDKFLGKTYNIPRPDNMMRSKWYTNKHFRGSYSFRSMESDRLNVWSKYLAEPIKNSTNKPIILFAGEATHDHYYSTVHGAIETGFREADRLIEYYSVRTPIQQGSMKLAKENIMQDCQLQETEVTNVVIVGAGIAGLAAAKTLQSEGFEDYLLLEAQERIGGRIDSIAWNNGWIECGAQWLHGEQSELANLCRYYDLLSDHVSEEGQGLYLRDDGVCLDERIINDIDRLVDAALEECKISKMMENDFSNNVANVGQALRSSLRKHLRLRRDPLTIRNMREELFDWYVRFLMIDNSCFTLDELSAKYWGQYESIGDLEHVNFKAGYNSLIQLLARGLNQKNIRLGCPVEKIEWKQSINRDDPIEASSKLVILTLTDHRKICANSVIVTCSLGYLKENYKTMFDPSLPLHLSQGIETLGFGLINKIFLDFGVPWWDSSSKGFQLVWSKNSNRVFTRERIATWTRDLTGFDVLKGHSAVLLGWVGGRGAHVIENLSEQQVAEDCVNLLKYFMKKDNIPMAKRCQRTKWHANKYIRGSYSHISVGCDTVGITPATLSKPVWSTVTHRNRDKCLPVIMFAGEATHDRYYSTTHGAFETGIKQAQMFLQHYAEKNC